MNSFDFKENNIIRITIDYPELRVEKPNIYLLKTDDGYVMIDCGGYDRGKDLTFLCSELYRMGIKEQEIRQIIITHTHRDHSFLAGSMQVLSGAEVFIGRADFPRVSGDLSLYRKVFRPVEDYLHFWGFDENMIARFFRSFGRQYYSAGFYEEKTCLIESEIEMGTLKIFLSPGHTSGSLCIYDLASGVLFTGDTLLKKIVSVPVIEYDPQATQGISMLTRHTETLNILKSIGYRFLCPGHGEPIPADIPVIDTIFSYIERRSRRVISLIAEGKNTVYKIARSLYAPDVLENVVFREGPLVYVSDLMMPLEYLLKMGKIRVEDGIIEVI